MKIKPLALITLLHMIGTAILWLWLFVIVMDYGFKDEVTMGEEIMSISITGFTAIIAAPLWVLGLPEVNLLSKLNWFVITIIIVINSFVQANIILWSFNKCRKVKST
jgi:hypothetical protein